MNFWNRISKALVCEMAVGVAGGRITKGFNFVVANIEKDDGKHYLAVIPAFRLIQPMDERDAALNKQLESGIDVYEGLDEAKLRLLKLEQDHFIGPSTWGDKHEGVEPPIYVYAIKPHKEVKGDKGYGDYGFHRYIITRRTIHRKLRDNAGLIKVLDTYEEDDIYTDFDTAKEKAKSQFEEEKAEYERGIGEKEIDPEGFKKPTFGMEMGLERSTEAARRFRKSAEEFAKKRGIKLDPSKYDDLSRFFGKPVDVDYEGGETSVDESEGQT